MIGFFGSFYFYEGLHLLLHAVPELRRRDPEIAVLLAGGGPEEANLRKLAAELGLESSVVFAGRVPHSDIQRYYDLADLLVFPRLSMRLTELVTPLKPLEAMAQERIVVASDVGGHRELVRDRETGYLFPPGDPAMSRKVFSRRLTTGRPGRWFRRGPFNTSKPSGPGRTASPATPAVYDPSC